MGQAVHLSSICTEAQPAFTIAAGFPGRDLVRLWPLPVQNPWFEDWWEPVEGDVTL